MISGEKLRKLRLLRKLTQKELAYMSGLTDSAIRNYELRYRSPDEKQLRKIAEALQCDVSALVDHIPISIFEFMQIVFDYEKDFKIRAHEFHYSDILRCNEENTIFKVSKGNGAEWRCCYKKENTIGGYPHIHFYPICFEKTPPSI